MNAIKKLRFFSIEQCKKCYFPDQNCFSVNLETGEYQLCSHAKLREHFEDWECDRCKERLGLEDLRHTIPVPPSKEIFEKVKQAKEEGKDVTYVKTYCELKTVCDNCFNELLSGIGLDAIFRPIFELFGFESISRIL